MRDRSPPARHLWVRARGARPPALPALVVLDPRMPLPAMLAAPWDPVCTVQCLGAPWSPALESVRAAVCHALQALGARTVLRVVEGDGAPTSPPDEASWWRDPVVGAAMREHGATLALLWCERRTGRVLRWSPEAEAYASMDAAEMRRFLRDVRVRASHLRLISGEAAPEAGPDVGSAAGAVAAVTVLPSHR